MPARDVVVVGASAGGVEALVQLVRGLPRDLPAAVFVVLHLPPTGPSYLPTILSRSGPLPAKLAEDGEQIQPGRIYVAVPDYHLLVHRERVRLFRGPAENGHRPAIDPLFRTAAQAYGPRVMGVILSGTLDDGTAGLGEIKARGGVTIVQSPDDCLFPGMALSAIENVAVDYVRPAAAIGPLLGELARASISESRDEVARAIDDPDFTEAYMAGTRGDLHEGELSGLTCPACGGALWEKREGGILAYRCRVGHAYAPDSLLVAQSDGLEKALWSALRALEEQASLARRLAERSQHNGRSHTAADFARKARAAEENAAVIRKVLLDWPAALKEELGGPEEPAAPGESNGIEPPAEGGHGE